MGKSLGILGVEFFLEELLLREKRGFDLYSNRGRDNRRDAKSFWEEKHACQLHVKTALASTGN